MAGERQVRRRRHRAIAGTLVGMLLGAACSPSDGAADSAAIDTALARETVGDLTGAPVAADSSGATAPRDSAPARPTPETEGQRRTDGSPRNPPIHRTTPRDDDVLNPRTGSDAALPQGDLMAQVRALAKTTGCATAGDCRALPVGRKACGGPRAYVVYCPASTNESALRAKIGEVDRADMEANRGAVSDCMLVTEPNLTVSGGQCRAGGAPR
jgi:hypothetical protein